MKSDSQSEMQSAAGQISPKIFPGGKIASFDGLRGVAIALVVVHHLLPGNNLEGGVELFFVLSGYLITTILLREHSKTGGIRYGRFLYRRLLRLYPALVVVTLVVAVGLVLSGLSGFALRQAAYALSYTFDLMISVVHVNIGPLGHTWSLSLEQQFYLTWPFVVLVIVRLHKAARVVAMSGLALLGVVGQVVLFADANNFGPWARVGSLLFGCLLAFGLDWRPVRLPPIFLFVAAAAFALLTVLVDVTETVAHVWVVPIATVIAFLAVWVLATAHDQGVGILLNRVIIHLGLMSYGVFLWHFPMIYFLDRADVHGAVAAAIVIPASLVMAELSRRFVENPFLRLKDRPSRESRRAASGSDESNGTGGTTAAGGATPGSLAGASGAPGTP